MTRAEIQRKYDDIVWSSQFSRIIDTPVKRYLSGMYVRLAFSVAAHLDTEVLMVDKLLAAGDYEFQKKWMEKLCDVLAKRRTVLLVSHNMSAVQNLCSHTIVLRRGRIVASGETSKMVESYIAKAKGLSEQVPLAKRQDRNGNGAFRAVDACVERDPVRGTGIVQSGSDIVIRVRRRNFQAHALRDIDLALGVDNYVGDRITILTT